MKKLISLLIVSINLFFYSTTSYADSVVKLSFSGNELIYPLPDGFCNITKNLQGIMLKQFLDEQSQPMLPTVQIIIAPCKANATNPEYPWGWVGMMIDKNQTPQKTLNKMVAGLLNNEDMLDAINKNLTESNTKAMEEVFGVQSNFDTNKQQILWADENSILLIQNAIGKIEDIEITETILTSTSVIGNVFVYTYIYNLKNGQPSVKDLSTMLINNAPKIKRFN